MELRVLQYFLAVAREQSFSKAADYLHLTQPTLSRQLKDLEDEIGKQLLIRSKRKVTLTDEGVFFRKRAEEIVSLADRTIHEISNPENALTGDIYIGSGESVSVRNIIRIAKDLQKENPGIHFHIISGDSEDLLEQLDKGLCDFCILFGDIDQSKYDYISLPYKETWGVLMRNDNILSEKDSITAKDLEDKPLIVSRQFIKSAAFENRFKKADVVNTYNLIYNATIMADEGMGYVLTLKGLVNTLGTNLVFKEITPLLEINISVVWKKYQAHSKASERFIKMLHEII